MKNKYLTGFLCLALSAVTVLSLSSCGKDTSKETPTTTQSDGKDVVLYTTETTTKKSWFKKEKDTENEEEKKDERVFSPDKKYFAVKASTKEDEHKYVIDIYSGDTNELSVELIPTENFTKFEWAENGYKLILYKGEDAVHAYKYNEDEKKWQDSVI